MIRIAVCDDEKIFAENLKKMVCSYFAKKHIMSEVDLFFSGEEFLKQDMDMAGYQIVFLDINMEGPDGIETARKMRKICRETFVIFVTAFINYTLEGYKVDAIRYILKNTANFAETVEESLDAVCEKMEYATHIREFHFKEGMKKIALEQIVYVESYLHKVYFYLLERKLVPYTMDATLNNIEKELQEGRFIRIHQSYLVNADFIKGIKSQKVILSDESELPVSKPRYKKVREEYAAYKGEL